MILVVRRSSTQREETSGRRKLLELFSTHAPLIPRGGAARGGALPGLEDQLCLGLFFMRPHRRS